MKTLKRTAKTVAIASIAALALTACAGAGNNSSSKDGSVEISMLVPTYSDHTKKLWEEVIEGFEAANEGITVDLQVESWENLESKVTTLVQGGNAPDIYNGGAFTSFVEDELLYPIEEVTSPETFEDFTDSFVKNASIDGTQYGAPLIASARALFGNKDLMDKAGVKEMPTTWDELKEAALKIAEVEGAQGGYGLPLGSEEAQAEAAIWFYGAGGGYGDEKEITVDTPENLEASKFLRALYEDGATQADPQASQRTPLMDVFVQGGLGFQIGLPPTIRQIEETNPDLNYVIGAIPTKDGSPFTLGVADHLVAFNNDDEDKKEAITKFFDYFFSADVYTKWVTTENFLPTTDSGNEAMSDNESIATFLELLPSAKFYPSANPNWQATANAMMQNYGRIIKEDPASVLAEIQSEADLG